MWHQRQRGRLGLETEHRVSLLRNLAKELVEHHRVITTRKRAKEASKFADKLVTIAKKQSLHARRTLISELGSGSERVAKQLMEVIAPKFSDRKGGYTRVLQYKFRQGDGAELALLEFSTQIAEPKAPKQKKEKKKKPETGETKKEHAHPHDHGHEKSKEQKKEAKETKKADEKKAGETPKKGGFLGGLRKFLTGKDE